MSNDRMPGDLCSICGRESLSLIVCEWCQDTHSKDSNTSEWVRISSDKRTVIAEIVIDQSWMIEAMYGDANVPYMSFEKLLYSYLKYCEVTAFDNFSIIQIDDEDGSKEQVKSYLLESDDEELNYFKCLIDAEISAREAEDLANSTNYVFGLYVDDQLVDTTNLDEDDLVHAIDMFMGEFGWWSKLTMEQRDTAHVLLIEEQRGGD